MVVEEQSPRRYCYVVVHTIIAVFGYYYRLLEVRSRFYELLTHCIPPEIIFRVSYFSVYLIYMYCLSRQNLLLELVASCDGALKAEVTQLAAHYEHQLQLGSKAIFHLEAFTAKFMSIYKKFLEEGLADMMAF